MQIVAHWREAGKWWDGEDQREIIRSLDESGALREESTIIRFPPSRLTLPKPQENLPSYTVDYDVMKADDRRHRHNVARLISEARAKYAAGPDFVPLHCLSALSFGRSSMSPEHIAALAYIHGMKAAAITDYFSLAGVVDFCKACGTLGIKPIIGAAIEIEIGGELVLLAKTQEGYKNLSRLITHCNLSQPRLFPLWIRNETPCSLEGIVCLTGGHGGPINRLLSKKDYSGAKRVLEELCATFGKPNVAIEIERTFTPWEISVNGNLLSMSEHFKLSAIAGGPIVHAERSDFPAQDALLCAETLCTVEEIIGRKPHRHKSQPQIKPWPQRSLNSEKYFRSKTEWAGIYSDAPQLIANACNLASDFPQDPLPPKPSFPKFCDNPEQLLRETVIRNARKCYPEVNVEHKYRLNGELERICRHGFASHFLAIWEACRWAKSKGILYSARGSAVDSAVAHCLDLSRIDAIKHGLHFDRFLPEDASKKPDIDIDFEAHRRDEVRNFFGERYGKDNVATVCAIATYQGRGIIRGIGKALMIPDDTISYLAKRLHGSVSGKRLTQGMAERPELRDSGIPIERFRLLFDLAKIIDGLPRHIGAHSSGVVITDTPICETVPVMESGREGVRIIQWDKYSSKKFFNKFDVLCLRGQDVMAETQRQVRETDPAFDANELPLDDERVFEEFRRGSLIGTPQSASPAMRQAHIRLRSANLHDVSLVQAGIRPGVGGAVKLNELIKRRRGTVDYKYSHPLFEAILGISYGIIVFQEQVDQLLQAFCGYSSGEAEDIRDNIYKRRSDCWDEEIKEEVLSRCKTNGFSAEIAEEVFELVSGFKGYGFAQGHALAFADLSIRCVYAQQHYPAEYFAALLSNQPAGYYGPGTIANEARIRGVTILPIDINKSQERFSTENGCIRVGLLQQFGLSKSTLARTIEKRTGGYRSIFEYCSKVSPDSDELECLILSGAFDSLHKNRRALLWILKDALEWKEAETGLVECPEPRIPEEAQDFSDYEKAVLERSMLSMDIRSHLMSFERERVARKGALTCADAQNKLKDREKAIVVGHAMRLRFPPTASGKRVVFFDLEDETGLLNVTCFDDTYQRDGHAIICSPFVTLKGEAQDRDGHMAFVAARVFPYQPLIDKDGFALERKAVHAEDFIHRAGR